MYKRQKKNITINADQISYLKNEEKIVANGNVQLEDKNKNITIKSFEGLLVDFAKENKVNAIVKGLRAMTDFDYELQMAQMNFNLADFETIFIPTSPEYGYVSSSLVKEIHSYGGDVSELVPDNVSKRLKDV